MFGTTSDGGRRGDVGTAFELIKTTDGYHTVVLHTFETAVDGSYPTGGVVIDHDGNVFGTTSQGLSGNGSVWELVRQGGGKYTFRTLHEFSGSDGSRPIGGLAIDASGTVYGTTTAGGPQASGTIFAVTPTESGAVLRTLYAFDRNDGNSFLSLTIDSSGNLYGSRFYGNSAGDVFELAKVAGGGYAFRLIHEFSYNDGGNPLDGVAVDAQGNVYGAALAGPAGAPGMVFELAKSGEDDYVLRVVHPFSNLALPSSGLAIDSSGAILGTSRSDDPAKGPILYRIAAPASQAAFSKLYQFPHPRGDLSHPLFDANLGLLFLGNIDADGPQNTLYRLPLPASGAAPVEVASGQSGTEGANPFDPLLADGNGDLFLVMRQGGAAAFGSVVELVRSGIQGYTPVVLHSFGAPGSGDGRAPAGPLSFDAAGDIYGSTQYGGDHDAGTVFELERSAGGYGYSKLYSFTGNSDGGQPFGALSDSAGHVFGIVQAGGQAGNGGVYELTVGSGGGTVVVIHPFSSAQAVSPLVRGSQGDMFATSGSVLFRISPDGSYSDVHTFSFADGFGPFGTLAVDSGTIYGLSSSTLFRISESGDGFKVILTLPIVGGGTPGPVAIDGSGSVVAATVSGGFPGVYFGTIFRIGSDGSGYTLLHQFGGAFDGEAPTPGLVADAAGNIVGATTAGGDANGGTVFRIESDAPAITINPDILPDGQTNVYYSQTQFSASGGTSPYRFGQSGDAHYVGLPFGLSLSDAGSLAGMPNTEGTFAFSISAEDAQGFVDSSPYSVTISPGPPGVPPSALPATWGIRRNISTRIVLRASDPTHNAQAFQFMIEGATLNGGVLSDLSPSDGTLTYTPPHGYVGKDAFEFVVSDEFGESSPAVVNIDVFEPKISPPNPRPPAQIGGR